MKTIFVFLIACCISQSAHCAELSASIENTDLGEIPAEASSAIKADASFRAFGALHCLAQGKKVALPTDHSKTTWFVTTKQACGWGAALGPIWLVEENSHGKFFLILSSGGYGLSVANKAHDGFLDISITSGTAEENSSRSYVFDGKSYELIGD